MSFTTFEFFLFIAAAVIIYYVIPKKLQWIWLLIISYVYYASYDISTVWMLLLTTYVTYRGGILLDRLNEQKPQDGIAFIILFFSARDEFYYLPFSDIIKFWERAKAGERKSFTYDEIDKSFRINSGKGIMIHYLETIQKDLDRREQ